MTLEAGIHHGVPFAVYNADPCPEPSLRSSLIGLLLNESPLHARQAHPRLTPIAPEDDADPKFDLGAAAHEYLLGGEERVRVCHPTTKDGKPSNTWATADAKKQRAEAYAAGQIPLLEHQAVAMREVAHLAERWFGAFPDREVTLVWQENGVWLRARPDALNVEPKAVARDYKTTKASAHPVKYARTFYGCGFDIQAALILRGMRLLTGADRPSIDFVIQQVEPPYPCVLVTPSRMGIEQADLRITRAIKLWGDCLKSGDWPGYPPGLHELDPPAYLMGEHEAMDQGAHELPDYDWTGLDRVRERAS